MDLKFVIVWKIKFNWLAHMAPRLELVWFFATCVFDATINQSSVFV